MFCAYLHCKPDGVPFYVGKGTYKRAYHFDRRNPYYKNTVAKYGVDNISVVALECRSEEKAFAMEKAIIRALRSEGVKLCNFTDGGEGAAGYQFTAEDRVKMSEARKGKSLTTEARAKVSAARRGKPLTEKHRMKLSAVRMGKPICAKTRAALLAVNIGKTVTPETRAKISAANTGKIRTAETRAKQSAVHTKRTPTTCPHCSKVGAISGMKRYHFDNCWKKNDGN